jgi:hypothetical protein
MGWNHTWQKCSLQGPYQVLLLFVPTALCSRWLLLQKIEISSIEDLNVIFYQNMPNLHNQYKSAERKFHRKTWNIC